MGSKTKSKSKKRKKIEQEVLDQIKKFGERLTYDDLIGILIGVYGAAATKNPLHFLTGNIGYKLARSPSILSSGAGLGILAALGLAGVPSEVWQSMYEGSLPKYPEWWPFKYPEGWPKYR